MKYFTRLIWLALGFVSAIGTTAATAQDAILIDAKIAFGAEQVTAPACRTFGFRNSSFSPSQARLQM